MIFNFIFRFPFTFDRPQAPASDPEVFAEYGRRCQWGRGQWKDQLQIREDKQKKLQSKKKIVANIAQ